MIRRFNEYEILNEGRFDSIINQITFDIYNTIKKSKKSIKLENEYHKPFNFIVELIIDRKYKKYVKDKLDYQIFDAWSDIVDGKPFLSLTVNLNPSEEPRNYNKLIGEIKGSLRHELEHLTQFGPNRIEDRPYNNEEEQELFYKYIEDRDIENIFLNKTEIPAYVMGLYKRAKTEKRPLIEIFKDRLNYFIRRKRITEVQKNRIMSEWIKYAKKVLPRVDFSE